ncbi:MAG: hypothetical protein IT561_07445 [Alphaproteobacteria bacterium]|nr:hypothetical protein [Alphaproteobacteria bacterium]
MILFVTTAAHRYAVGCLVDGTFGAALPRCAVVDYESLFRAVTLPTATYIFADIERLQPWELAIAAELYRGLAAQGVRCLNDPARVMARFELLRTLHRRGINPFDAYRADEAPQPRRFPVFLRNEGDHATARTALLRDQGELDAALARLRRSGISPRGLLVMEFAAEPIAPGIWRKFGTFRTADAYSVDHAVIENRWLVKYGTIGLATDPLFRHEQEAVTGNVYAEAVRPAFEVAGIEWGRADHATVAGREVVYEINTNPHIRALSPQTSPIRDETLLRARRRLADHLHAIDAPPGGAIPVELGPQRAGYRRALGGKDPGVAPRP